MVITQVKFNYCMGLKTNTMRALREKFSEFSLVRTAIVLYRYTKSSGFVYGAGGWGVELLQSGNITHISLWEQDKLNGNHSEHILEREIVLILNGNSRCYI
jgi:hypothetical protein